MKCYNPTLQRRKDGLLIEAACGKCKACIINKKIILAKEIKMYNQNKTDGLFLTITYDEKEKKEINKREIQLFLKKLRKTTKNKIKYVIIGEYGKKTKRPHYHALL
jgi:7-cyano-7-deazaguanine synthase in queuosine biosynthesis